MGNRQTKPTTRRTRKKLTPEEEFEALEEITRAHSGNVLDKMRVDIKCKTQNQKKLITEIKNKEMVICSGLPGTGKTFLSCAMALELLKNDPRYRKIVIVKSVTSRSWNYIGFTAYGNNVNYYRLFINSNGNDDTTITNLSPEKKVYNFIN